jgi:hypothetical protein
MERRASYNRNRQFHALEYISISSLEQVRIKGEQRSVTTQKSLLSNFFSVCSCRIGIISSVHSKVRDTSHLFSVVVPAGEGIEVQLICISIQREGRRGQLLAFKGRNIHVRDTKRFGSKIVFAKYVHTS